MPDKKTQQRAARDKARGKAPSTQAGEFVREEIEHVRQGKHGVRSAKQAIAIGLSKARRAGVALPPPRAGQTSTRTRRKAAQDSARGRESAGRRPSTKRSGAALQALKREGRDAASSASLARQGRAAASRRRPSERSAAAEKAGRT